MFNFFKKEKKVVNVAESNFEIELTASVLAYELARSDGSITQEELSVLMSEIEKVAEKVGKEKEEIFRIIKIYSKESVSFYEFVEDINQNYSKQEKLNLLKLMWKTAYADKKLDVDEEKLIRRLANLINIKDMDVLKLKDLFRT
tara:strand:- start:1417 stop:1848 length:432 start_codon:yes stop_codon:yes gene_type:complete